MLRATPILLGLLLAMTAAVAFAQPTPTADARKEAAKAFAEGVKAFAAKDYVLAASRFDEAYRLAPHPNALWNEAQALQRAGEGPRAANTYAKFLREAPSDAHDLADATKALADLARKLVRVDFTASGFDTVLLDDARVEPPSVYVEPGRHVLEGRKGDQVARTEVSGEAGSVVAATLTPPAPAASQEPAPSAIAGASSSPAATAPPATTTAPPAPTTPDVTPHGWSPTVVYVDSAVTAVLLGATIWSGADALSFKNGTYDATPDGPNYDQGKRREVRTNVLLGFTLGAAALTAVAAIWLVDWHGGGGSHAALGVGLGTVAVRGELP